MLYLVKYITLHEFVMVYGFKYVLIAYFIKNVKTD